MLFWSCQAPPPERPACAQSFQPADRIEDTDCDNPCIFGYAGTVEFHSGLLLVHCREVESGLRMYLHQLPTGGGDAPSVPVVVIEAPASSAVLSQGLFCRHDLRFESLEDPVSFRNVLFAADPVRNLARIYLVAGPDSNGRLERASFRWTLSTREPLPLQ